jgi:hypothetical protein
VKKTVLSTLVVAGLMAYVPMAGAAGITVKDPTPTQTFSGTYQCGWETEADPDNPGQTRYKLDANGDKIPVYCDQQGYVYAGDDGVVACNGNQEVTRPDDGTPLQGYIWVGPGLAASNPTAASPGNVAGAGNNHETADGEPTGESPCPEKE